MGRLEQNSKDWQRWNITGFPPRAAWLALMSGKCWNASSPAMRDALALSAFPLKREWGEQARVYVWYDVLHIGCGKFSLALDEHEVSSLENPKSLSSFFQHCYFCLCLFLKVYMNHNFLHLPSAACKWVLTKHLCDCAYVPGRAYILLHACESTGSVLWVLQ